VIRPIFQDESAILDLFYVYLRGLCYCAEFGLNRRSSFDNMPVFVLRVLLEISYSHPFLGVFFEI